MLIAVIVWILALTRLPTWPALSGYILYFLIPFLMLFKALDYERSRALKYALWVSLVAIVTEIPFVFFLRVGSIEDGG